MSTTVLSTNWLTSVVVIAVAARIERVPKVVSNTERCIPPVCGVGVAQEEHRFGISAPGFNNAPIWITGSRHLGEEDII